MPRFEEKDFSEIRTKGIWKRLLGYALKEKKILTVGLLEMALVAACDVVFPLMTRYSINNFIVPGTSEGLPFFALLYVLLVGASSFGVYGFIKNSGLLEMQVSYAIRRDAFHKLQQLSFSYYDTMAVGHIMSRMVSDVARLSELMAWSMTDIVFAAVSIVGFVGVMFSLNFRLALMVLVIVVPIAILSNILQKLILKYQRQVRRVNSKITAAYNEGIAGAVTTKTLDREEESSAEFRELTGEMRRTSIRSATVGALMMPMVMFFGSIGSAIALWQGGSMVEVISFGTLSAFISYSTQLFDPILTIVRIIGDFQSARAAAERVFALLDEPCEITDTPEVIAEYGTEFAPKTENWPPIRGDIEFRDVSFAYKNSSPLFTHFNLKVRAGENIAIVGETGAGKSSLVNLVCRFYEPTACELLIDGVDYRKRSMLWLQKSLGYVLQTPHLFSGSIADNIRYARPDASMEEVKAAAALIGADGFIERLEKGYETDVGEGGTLLSTGQKQLVSFARVVLADPRIFVLDEATSSIDTETEAVIQNAITKVLAGRTSFIIAHRLSTIRHADRILVVSAGKVVESGTHEELIAAKGQYYKLYTVQSSREREQELLDGAE